MIRKMGVFNKHSHFFISCNKRLKDTYAKRNSYGDDFFKSSYEIVFWMIYFAGIYILFKKDNIHYNYDKMV